MMVPELEARNLLEEMDISELPVVPADICRRLEVIYLEQEFKSIDGMLLVNDTDSLISVNSLIKEQGRKNFTCAHELGHLCLDSHKQSEFRCSRNDIESFKKSLHPIEVRANEFAAELLMPSFLYKPLVDAREPDWDHIRELAGMSETTLLATAVRFVALTEQACVLIVSRTGNVWWFRSSGSFTAYVEMGPVAQDTVAHLVFRGSVPPNGFEVIKADNWVSGRVVKPHTEILEWTLPMNSYGQVLTILFDEDGALTETDEGYDENTDQDEYSVQWEPPTFHKSKRKR